MLGGERLGKEFLASLVLPAGMRALLYLESAPNFRRDQFGRHSRASVGWRASARPFIEQERQNPVPQTFRISWTAAILRARRQFHALPLLGRQKELLGVLLVGSSQREAVLLERRIRDLALGVVALGLFFG